MRSGFRLVVLFVSAVSADLGYTDSYGAPYAPSYDSYSAPAAPQQYQQPAPQQYHQPAVQYQNPNSVNHGHVHHHYYHPSNPIVRVPVTQQPFVVKVPQNVPVKFIPVNVPTQAPQYQHLPVQYAPAYGYHLQDNECHDTDLDCFKKIANDWFGDGGSSNNGYAAPAPYAPSSPYAAAAPSYPTAVSPYGGAYPNAYPSQAPDDGYIKRKELIKSALLLGAGVVKGAVITTLINQAQGNGK